MGDPERTGSLAVQRPGSIPRRAVTFMAVIAVALTACARHADFQELEQLAQPSEAEAIPDTADPGKPTSPGRTGKPELDPCLLLTETEMQEAVGGIIVSPDRFALPILVGMEMCQFNFSVAESTETTLAIGVWRPASAAGNRGPTAAGVFKQYRERNEEFGLADVEDLGDEAVWDEELGILLARSGDRTLGLTVFFTHPPAVGAREVAVELAQLALARMSQAA